ncbi:terminase small subunit [Nocardioides alkalitolerans]|uniref:terminase small subunit n=1 Tax=Nocardioides alkalitolerans TaxID=281714 RepID=UPI0003FFC128|nr:hypothetical protein [Nocardioides alkalitolerans]
MNSPLPLDVPLVVAYDVAVLAAGEVGRVDAAVVAAGRTIAQQIDDVMETGTPLEKTKALYLMPHLLNVLRELLATPKARDDAGRLPGSGALQTKPDVDDEGEPTKRGSVGRGSSNGGTGLGRLSSIPRPAAG